MRDGTPRTPDDMADVVLVAGRAQEYSGNVHEELKLVLVTGSRFTVRRRGTAFQAAPGQLIALHADDAHSGVPEDLDTADWLIMCVSPGLIAEVASPERLRFEDPVIPDGALATRFQSLCRDLYAPPVADSGATLRRETRMLEFVAALAWRSTGDSGAEAGTAAAVAEVVREYLRENLTRNVTLDELTEVTGVSKYRLVRLCTDHYGLPPHKLHMRLRLDHARELLRRGVGIAEAAYETGFHDQPHLTRMFARAYGMTPAVYRSSYNGVVWSGQTVRGR